MADRDRDQEEAAAREAGAIGGPGSAQDEDPASQPLVEAGQGEAEGFEQAERELVERASHGDQHAARRVADEPGRAVEEPGGVEYGEADHSYSSEADDDH